MAFESNRQKRAPNGL